MSWRTSPERACPHCGISVVWFEPMLNGRPRANGMGSYRELDSFGRVGQVHFCSRGVGREGVPPDYKPGMPVERAKPSPNGVRTFAAVRGERANRGSLVDDLGL